MSENSLVSIIMPCYNCEKYVETAIRSILNQTYNNMEIIITDDCSIDNTSSIIESLAINDKRITFVKNKSNLELITSLNNSLDIAHGKYIARMDADDISLPDRIEKQVYFLETHPEYVICGTGAWHINSSDKIVDMSIIPLTSEEIENSKFFGSPFYHPSIMIKKEIKELLKYDLNYIYAEDYALWLSILKNHRGMNLKERLIKYRIHEDSVSNKNKNKQSETLVNIFSKHLTGGDFSLARLYVYNFYAFSGKTNDLRLDNTLIAIKEKYATNLRGYNFYIYYKYFRYFLRNKRMSAFINNLSLSEQTIFFFKLSLYFLYALGLKIYNIIIKKIYA
jgi:glycosyltransferase involved in cell wall biosynthesis